MTFVLIWPLKVTSLVLQFLLVDIYNVRCGIKHIIYSVWTSGSLDEAS